MQKIRPCLWVVKDVMKVVDYYLSIFRNGKLINYQAFEDSPSGKLEFATIEILGIQFQILASGSQFAFNEAVSFSIVCKDQEEVDYYWSALTSDGGSEGPCGWLKDKHGLSWQIVPVQLDGLLEGNDPIKHAFAFNAMLKMTRIIIANLEEK